MKTRKSNTKSISKRVSEVRTNNTKTVTETTIERTGERELTANGWRDIK